jgi:hypothetical protein
LAAGASCGGWRSGGINLRYGGGAASLARQSKCGGIKHLAGDNINEIGNRTAQASSYQSGIGMAGKRRASYAATSAFIAA